VSAYVLAVDLGTSGPKVGLVSTDGRVLRCAVASTKLSLSPGGGAEQDPEDWWRAITQACAELRAAEPAAMDAVACVSCTAQWSGTVAVDAEGRPLRPALIWMDSRGAHQIKKLIDGAIKISGYAVGKLLRYIRLTGGAPGRSGKDPIAHILWLKEAEPEVYAAAHQLLEPKDWLNHRLCGRFASTYDAIALHWVTDNRDLGKVAYHAGLLRRSGIAPEKLPALVASHAVLGPVTAAAAAALSIPKTAIVVGGSPDMQSAALGSGGIKDYESHLYIGTSSWIACHVPFKKTDLLHNIASLPSAVPGRYFVGATQECAGVCVSRFVEEWLYADDGLAPAARPADAYARFEAAAASVAPGSKDLLFLPWLYGERAPVEDHRLRGGFLNMDLSTTRPQLARAVLEGVAYNTRWLFGYVEKFIGRPIERLSIIGGGARSDTWCQIFADVLAVPIVRIGSPLEANVRGAALLGAWGLGASKWDAPAANDDDGDVVKFSPRAEHRAVYDRGYLAFREAHRRNQPLFAKLNDKE
jgi:xylulokinase